MPATTVMPLECPSWISEQLIQETVRVWQPYYAEPLTREDAIAMITTVGRLFSILTRGDCDETVCGTGTSEQSGTGT